MTLLKLTLFLGSTLIPDESSLVGKEVTRLWKLINAVKVEIVTFGVVNFQDLSKSGLHPMAQGMKGEVVYRNNFYPPRRTCCNGDIPLLLCMCVCIYVYVFLLQLVSKIQGKPLRRYLSNFIHLFGMVKG